MLRSERLRRKPLGRPTPAQSRPVWHLKRLDSRAGGGDVALRPAARNRKSKLFCSWLQEEAAAFQRDSPPPADDQSAKWLPRPVAMAKEQARHRGRAKRGVSRCDFPYPRLFGRPTGIDKSQPAGLQKKMVTPPRAPAIELVRDESLAHIVCVLTNFGSMSLMPMELCRLRFASVLGAIERHRLLDEARSGG